MDSRSVRHWHVNKVKPKGGLYCMFAAPDALYGITCIAPSSGFIWAVTDGGAPDSSNRGGGLNDRSCILIGEAA